MWIRMGTALLVLLLTSPARAEEPCPKTGDAWTLARCAVSHSAALLRARHELGAARGRRLVAQQVLPANPTLDLSLGGRRGETGATDLDRGVELSQAFEVGGQRGLRIAVSDSQVAAAIANVEAGERQLTVDVLAASIEVQRAQIALDIARDQRRIAERLVDISTARMRDGVGPALDVELAEAARVQARREELSAARAQSGAAAHLALVVGADVQLAEGKPIEVAGPHAGVDELVRQATERRQVVLAAGAEATSGRRRIDLLRRERVPNVTVGAFYRHEEFGDVAGGRLSVPLPVFRRNQGEIAEQQALVAEADIAAGQARLKVALEVRAAHAAWQKAQALVQDLPGDLAVRLEADSLALRDAYERGTLPLPSALASLREVWNARKTVADARAEAGLATLDLITASAGQARPASEAQP